MRINDIIRKKSFEQHDINLNSSQKNKEKEIKKQISKNNQNQKNNTPTKLDREF